MKKWVSIECRDRNLKDHDFLRERPRLDPLLLAIEYT